MSRRSKGFKLHACQLQHIPVMYKVVRRLIFQFFTDKEGKVSVRLCQAVSIILADIHRRTCSLAQLCQRTDVVTVAVSQHNSDNLGFGLLNHSLDGRVISTRIENNTFTDSFVYGKVTVGSKHTCFNMINLHSSTSVDKSKHNNYNSFVLSSKIVTGPLFTSSTSICARKMPVSTGSPALRQPSTKRS